MEKLPNDIIISFLMLIDEKKVFNSAIRINKSFHGILSNDDFWRNYYRQRSGKRTALNRKEIYHLLSSQFLWKCDYTLNIIDGSTIPLPRREYRKFSENFFVIDRGIYSIIDILGLASPLSSSEGEIFPVDASLFYRLSNGELFYSSNGGERKVTIFDRKGAKIVSFFRSVSSGSICVNGGGLLLLADHTGLKEKRLPWVPNRIFLRPFIIILIKDNDCYQFDMDKDEVPKMILSDIADYKWVGRFNFFLTTTGDVKCYTDNDVNYLFNEELSMTMKKKVGKVSSMVENYGDLYFISPIGEIFMFCYDHNGVMDFTRLEYKNAVTVIRYSGKNGIVTAN